MRLSLALTALIAVPSSFSLADDPLHEPRPIPLTRVEMKEYLEDMKDRTPRIPIPELTEEQLAELGERVTGYEGLLRALYMPPREEGGGRGFFGGSSRDPDPNMTLDYAFKVQLFWIVSRVNNCQYCLGHQESKLLNAGLLEDEIAALDGNWLQHTPAEQAAFAFARKITYEPHLLSDADIDGLRPYFTDLQILEMILSTAGNNAINRWKEGVGVPQSQNGGSRIGRPSTEPGTSAAADLVEEDHSYLTPTSPQFQSVVSAVAPVTFSPAGSPTHQTVCNRPALESWDEVLAALLACREREPRLPLVEPALARELVGELPPAEKVPQWVLLLANFPRDGVNRIRSQYRAEQEEGDLSPLLRAQVSWIVARQDRAWYATSEAYHRLRELGVPEEQIAALDGDWSTFTPAERALFTVARHLAASPVVLTDAEVAQALDHAGPRVVVQLISYITSRASFNRITESAGLRWED